MTITPKIDVLFDSPPCKAFASKAHEAIKITGSITRDQVAQLVVQHGTADNIFEQAKLYYRPKKGLFSRFRKVTITVHVAKLEKNHLFSVHCVNEVHSREIIVTLDPTTPHVFRSDYQLFALGIGLDSLSSTAYRNSYFGHSISPDVSSTGDDMVALASQ